MHQSRNVLESLIMIVALAALLAPIAHAQVNITIEVNPGTVGEPANDLSWSLDDEVFAIDLVFADHKTCELPPDLHIIDISGAPGVGYVGVLLDESLIPITGAELVGATGTDIDPTAFGFIELSNMPGATVFGGIRLLTPNGFPPSFWGLEWVSSRPTVGQAGSGGGDLENQYLIPAASLAAGAEGSFYQSDVDVNNWDGETATYAFMWLPRGQDNSMPLTSEEFTLASGASARYDNVLAEVFGLGADVNGAVAVVSDSDALVVMSRTYNLPTAKATGTFGQAISGIPSSDLLGQGEIGRIVYISEDQDFRTNLGCANGVAENIRILIDLYDDQGAFLETKTMDLAPWSNQQLNTILGDYAPINGYADVRSDTAGAGFYCYGSMLDNGSSDPTTVVPVVR